MGIYGIIFLYADKDITLIQERNPMKKIISVLSGIPYMAVLFTISVFGVMILFCGSEKRPDRPFTRELSVMAHDAEETPTETTTAETTASSSAASETTAEISTETTVTTETSTETQTETSTNTDTSSETSSETTASVTSADTQTSAVPNEIYDFVSAGESPNSGFYQSRLTVIGDSIAYGFNCYGFIPTEHNLATESVSIWNFGEFTFDKGGGTMGIIDAADYVHPSLIYISLGLNDVNNHDPAGFATSYSSVISQLQSRMPDAVIVIGGITPVSADCWFTDNATIMEYNNALAGMAAGFASPKVLYFDAFSVLCDPATNAQNTAHAGGDGIHLGPSAYSLVLSSLFNFLDYNGASDLIY